MRFHTRDLLTLLISLFIFASCENPSGVGLEVNPEDQLLGVKTDTLTIRTVTLKDDSSSYSFMNRNLHGSVYSQTVFGYLNDPVIGTSVADLAISLGRPTTVPRIRTDAEIDSVILVLAYGSDFTGDSLGTSSFALQVRQLNEGFLFNTANTRQWDVKPTVIGSKTINRFRYTDSLTVTKHINEIDSIVEVIPQLRIPLSASFFKELFSDQVDSALLSTGNGFRDHVKGLYLSTSSDQQSGLGALVALAAITDVTGVELTFRQPNGLSDEDADIDTIRTFFPIAAAQQSNTGTINSGLASSVTRTFSTEVQQQLNNPGDDYQTIYVQAYGGLRSRISFPYLNHLIGKNIVINKAELVIYTDEEQTGTVFTQQAQRLTLYREDIAGQRQFIPDGSLLQSASGGYADPRSLGTAFGGFYDTAEKRYIFSLTSFIQDVLLGKINNSDLYIAPMSRADASIALRSAVNTGHRAIIGGGSSIDYKMKLNIYYTEID